MQIILKIRTTIDGVNPQKKKKIVRFVGKSGRTTRKMMSVNECEIVFLLKLDKNLNDKRRYPNNSGQRVRVAAPDDFFVFFSEIVRCLRSRLPAERRPDRKFVRKVNVNDRVTCRDAIGCSKCVRKRGPFGETVISHR